MICIKIMEIMLNESSRVQMKSKIYNFYILKMDKE